MNKLIETITTLLLAARYSFAFCWRNSKKETIGRMIISTLNTLTIYLMIQANGLVINAVQKSKDMFKGRNHSFFEIMNSGIMNPIILLTGVFLLVVVLNRLNWFYRHKWNNILRFANQRELNNHRATLDVGCFRSQKYDDLQKRIQELPTSWQTRIWFSDEMFSLFTTIISFVLFGASLLFYKPVYALVLLVAAIPMAVVNFKLVSMWWSMFQELVPQHKKRNVLEKPYHEKNAFIQALMFNQMPTLRKEIDVNVGNILEEYDKIRKTSVKKEILYNSFVTIGLCGVVIHAIYSIIAYSGDIGTFTIIVATARTFQSNLESIVSAIADQWNNAKGVILIEKDFFGLKPIVKTEYPVTPRFNITPMIKFDHVSFKYPDTDVMVLKDISFTIEPGSKIAIVGKSGNGKSTIQALLMRNYDPTSGSVYADTVNLSNIEPKDWNNVISALTQEFLVLERSIAEEIASSRLDQPIDMEGVIRSAQFANFDEVVNSDPKGFGSQIGTEFGGREFSGGEKQRLALARVHYRGTPIIILDEPDAKLDPESAQKVIDQMFALKGITVVMITHHVSRAERCDKVIVMGKGEIVEQGTHQELMALDGTYTSLCQKDKERLGTESQS